MLKLVTTTDVPGRHFGIPKAIEMIAEAGFDGCDWSMFPYAEPGDFFDQPDWRVTAASYKKTADENHVPFLQAHAPFPTFFPEDAEKTARLKKALDASIEACSIVECPNIIFHPGAFYPLPTTEEGRAEILKKNIEFYGAFLPRAKELGVTICTENMFGYSNRYQRITPCYFSFADELNALVDALDGQIGVCLDTGHTVLVNDTMQHMARVFGKRLKALHVHSNDGVHDSHTAPLIFPMDWEEFGAALHEVDYDGPMTLEADNFLVPLPKDMIALGLRFLCENARYVASLVK